MSFPGKESFLNDLITQASAKASQKLCGIRSKGTICLGGIGIMLSQTPSHIAQNLPRRVVAWRAGDAATGMRARAAHVEP